MSRNTRAPLFRPPWLPTPVERRAQWRAEQRRTNPQPPRRALGLYDADWQELRRAVLAAEPLCRLCARVGIERAAQVVDHIVPIREDPSRRLDVTNCQPLCWPCHRAKSNRYDGGFGRKLN
jgi:5-methylcytosine-specific restriction protein A